MIARHDGRDGRQHPGTAAGQRQQAELRNEHGPQEVRALLLHLVQL